VIDGVSLWDFDYIDLGKVRLPSNTVPVTVKSLLFGAAMDATAIPAAAPPPVSIPEYS
jgi:ethanolamine utilization protein EutA